jgi:hypothetical protein
MIDSHQRAYIAEHAYVPEHLPDYVSAISRTEPHLIENFVVHVQASNLIFVGYPLKGKWDEDLMIAALDLAKNHFNPTSISIISPVIPSSFKHATPSTPDAYYRLDLKNLSIPKKTRNMVKRARGEVTIQRGQFGRKHKRLIKAFLRQRDFDEATRFIFQRVPAYLSCDSAALFEARNTRDDLVAFDIADFGARRYAFYMFNIRSWKHKIPGVSDLLLKHILEQAQKAGKRYLNLGLGINPGVAFFKQKWGAKPFLQYTTWVVETPDQTSWFDIFDQLSR